MRAALLVLLFVLLGAADAVAGTVALAPTEVCGVHGEPCPARALFTAAGGEANDITTQFGQGMLTIADAGAGLTASGGCHAIDEHTASCPAGRVDVTTGDGDDRVHGDAIVIADLGPGDDNATALEAYGGPGDDVLTGNRLDGGAGTDTMIGTVGDDSFVAGEVAADGTGAPAGDTIDGGPGRDTVSYDGDPLAVRVDLEASGLQGSPGEGDTIASVENAVGGAGNDVLRGDGQANELFGGPGEDVLEGGDGADRLTGGSGFDRFSGGAGDDVIDAHGVSATRGSVVGALFDHALDASPEPIDCGPGRDGIFASDGDLISPTCEGTAPTSFTPIVFPRIRRGIARFALTCPFPRCRGTIALRDLDYDIGRSKVAAFRVPHGGGGVAVRLPARLTVPLDRERHLAVTISRHQLGRLRIISRYVLWLPEGCTAPSRCGATP